MIDEREPWWSGGLRFACTGCGACCTGPEGTVRVSAEERDAIARLLGLAPDAFERLYLRAGPGGALLLRERPGGDCVFLGDEDGGRRGCAVYPERPRQCRTWPFWRGVVATREHWRRAGRGCPGIGRGPLHGADAIRASLANDGTSGHVPPLS